MFLKQSTADDVLIGPFLDLTDKATAETGESPVVKLSKNGQALAAKNDATTPAHDADGYYNCELDAIDTDTVGTLVLTVAASAAALPVSHEFQVVEEAIYNALYAADASIQDAVWDEVLTGATHNVPSSAGRRLRALQDFGLYEGGAVWIDTVNGASGTTNFENGTITNPSLTLADALTIAVSLNLKSLRIVPGSTITLAAALQDYVVFGNDYVLVLGGQNVNNSIFAGADAVSGIFLGNPGFDRSHIDSITGSGGDFHDCGFRGTITANAAGDWLIHHCQSDIAGETTPIFDFGTDVGVGSNVTFSNYHNGIEIRNLNNSGTDLFSISGQGQIIYAASSSGTVNQRGDWKVTNTGGVTITADDNTTNLGTIADDVWDEPLSEHNTAGSAGKALRQIKEGVVVEEATVNDAAATTTSFVTTLPSAVDNFYIDVSLVFIGGVLAGQSRPILSYDGPTKTIVLDEALTSAPADGVGFIITSDHVHPVSQIVTGILTTQMTEAYAADGVAPTLAQAIFEILQQAGEFSITDTTITVKKLDGSTAAMTFTLDDANNPTSRTRAT